MNQRERLLPNAEQMLRASEERHHVLFDYSPLPKWLYDVNTLRFLEVNQAAVRHYGYSRDEFLRMTVKDIRPPEDVEAVIRKIEEIKDVQNTIEAGPVSFGVWTHRKKDGTLIDVEITGHTFEFEGRVVRLIVAHDITERLRAEQALRVSEERYRLLLDSTGEGIYGIDTRGHCTLANRACARLLGYESADELLGKHMHSLMHHTKPNGAPYPEEECRIYQAFRRGQGTNVEDEIFWRADGTSFPAEYFSFPIKQGDNVIGSVVTFRDITEKRQAEESGRKLAAERDRLLEQLGLSDRTHASRLHPLRRRLSHHRLEPGGAADARVYEGGSPWQAAQRSESSGIPSGGDADHGADSRGRHGRPLGQ